MAEVGAGFAVVVGHGVDGGVEVLDGRDPVPLQVVHQPAVVRRGREPEPRLSSRSKTRIHAYVSRYLDLEEDKNSNALSRAQVYERLSNTHAR